MPRRHLALPLAPSLALLLAACAARPTPVGSIARPPVGPAARPTEAAEGPVWMEDSLGAATARARAEGKLLVVDAWAPWCHTCLSMQQEVLHDPALGRYATWMVFAAIDTDRASSASFLERYAIEVWPTFFVIDPAKDRVLAVHGGSASLPELLGVLDGALALRASSDAGAFETALATGADAYAGRRFEEAAVAYERAAAMEHPRRSEALLGAIRALYERQDFEGCARVATHGLPQVRGAAMAADFSYYARACAAKLPEGPVRSALERGTLAKLRALTADPPVGATVDDRADALAMLAEAERAAGDEVAARRAIEARVAVLDQAAAAAGSSREAAVFDYLRMRAYEDAGRPEAAIAMLEARTRETPDNYEPFARLASVLGKTDPVAALVPLRRAVELSYGPRRIRYLEQEVDLLGRLGDAPGRVAALERLVAAERALPAGHADAARRAKAEASLSEARAAAPR